MDYQRTAGTLSTLTAGPRVEPTTGASHLRLIGTRPFGAQAHSANLVPGRTLNPRIAAVMFPLDPDWRLLLEELLGDGWEIRAARMMRAADAVLVHPCSSQTLRALRRRFPDSCIVVVERSLYEGSHLDSPVDRVLEAGADMYLAEISDWAA